MLGFISAKFDGSSISVLEPDDVVLTQIGAALHFDQFHGDPAGVGEAVFATHRDVGVLVLV